MKYELHSEIAIDAPPETVWEILIDLEHYAEWNPFVVSSIGTPQVGESLVNRLEPPGGKAMTFKPRVTVVEDAKIFEWVGHLVLPGLFDGRHRFEIQATDTGTLFRQDEFFSGLLVRMLRKSLDDNTLRGFEAMNLALKQRAEAR